MWERLERALFLSIMPHGNTLSTTTQKIYFHYVTFRERKKRHCFIIRRREKESHWHYQYFFCFFVLIKIAPHEMFDVLCENVICTDLKNSSTLLSLFILISNHCWWPWTWAAQKYIFRLRSITKRKKVAG